MKKEIYRLTFSFLLILVAMASHAKGVAGGVYFVDATRPDNSGDGRSWATAKKDIQVAINLATTFDQVWVKAGTYYPTDIPAGLTASGANSPVSNRDKTLLLKDGLKIYGGFAGTELALADRVPGNNPTIIDGDIGTPGDSTDNCYHLMVYLGSYTSVGVTIDGFTIRNGNAGTYGAGVPVYDASTLSVGDFSYPIERVYGGGIFLRQGLNNVVNNVVFEKNYAKNRGFALFTDGGYGLTCSYTVTSCYFVNNYGIQSSYGSWATNFGNNYGYNLVFYNNQVLQFGFGSGVAVFLFDGVNKFVNCSFVSNSSIMGATINLANGAKTYFTNCLFYNNKQSPIYNPTNPDAPDFFDSGVSGSFGKFTNCSMSAKASTYIAPNLAMAGGSSGNIFNLDPAFSNINNLKGSDGKYYTSDDGLALLVGSPGKNAGNNDSIPVALTKDITGAARIIDSAVDIGAYEIDGVVVCTPPASPVTSNQVFCDSASAKVANLSATGTNIKWYGSATGGLPLSANSSLTDGAKYYATQTVGSCESTVRAVDSVTVFANGAPAPNTANQTFCKGATVANLTATGTNIKWYASATGGDALADTALLANHSVYYASQTIAGCEGLNRSADTISISVPPIPVADTLQRFCGPIGTSSLAVTGTSINWYRAIRTSDSTVYSLQSNVGRLAANDTLYVTQNVNGCESPKLAVHEISQLTPTMNPVNDTILCSHNNSGTFHFSGAGPGTRYNWADSNSAIGLPVSGSGDILPFTTLNSTNVALIDTIIVTPVYTMDTLTCSGNQVQFSIIVNPAAVVNSIDDQTYCAGVTSAPLKFSGSASDNIYTWSNSNPAIGLAAGGTGDIPSFLPINSTAGSIFSTITVTPTTQAGCTGASGSFVMEVNSLSTAPVAIDNAVPVICASNPFASLRVNGGVLGSGAVWKWYADSLGGNSIGTGEQLNNFPVSRTTTFYVRAEGTCNVTEAASLQVKVADLVSHVRQHWADVLVFDNSSNNFVQWQWYKNNQAIDGAIYPDYSESTDLNGVYYVVATDKSGNQEISCPLQIVAGHFTGLSIKLSPNPAVPGTQFMVTNSFNAVQLTGSTLTISDIFSRVISQTNQVSTVTTMRAPNTSGIYIVTLTLADGNKYSANLLIN